MKTIYLIAMALAMSLFGFSQKVIENPQVGMSTAQNVTLQKIELLDTATILWFQVKERQGRWISIPDQSYIQPVGANEKLFILAADGININEQFTMPASGEVSYKLTFPKVDASVSKLDYGEANDGGSWFIYDIQLKPELFKSILPEKVSGNWFRTDNAQWEISLFDSVAVYQSKIWKYQQYSETSGIGKIKLKSGSKLLDLYIKTINDSSCQIGETPSKLVNYVHQPDQTLIPEEKAVFKLPVFKTDTAIYRGYFKGFSLRYPQRTGMVYVNDVLTGEQLSYLLKIEDDGSFEVKFPHNNPQGVFVRSPLSFETIFIEPGKTTFQLIDNGSHTNPVLFMGGCARINTDLLKLKDINSFNYDLMLDKVLEFTPEQYKTWCQELQQKDLDQLQSVLKTKSISAKAEQVKKLELTYRYSSFKFEYSWNVDAAYRKKNNIPRDQREIPFKPEVPDSTYYNFLTNDLANNPLAVLTSDYSSFINRLMFLNLLRGQLKGLTTLDIIVALEKSGYKFTPEENEFTARMKEIDSPELKKLQEDFQTKYGDQMRDFNEKYAEKIKTLYTVKKGSEVTTATIKEYLISEGVEFTDQEKSYLSALNEFDDNPLIKKRNLIQSEIGDASNQFHTNHREFVNGLFRESATKSRNEKIQSALGIQLGLATDIMNSQEYCRPIVSEMTPVSAEKLKQMQSTISTPFIANYIAVKNVETIAKIEANKMQKGSTALEVPKSGSDNLFDAIINKYRGKVVYVDFWATWCGPCRSGIEQIKPLKDEMKDENVAFVYITNQTSPKGTYDNMIPTIKGEHYRVSADEWNFLCDKFKISGIPHCVLVGKGGDVINSHLSYMGNQQLKTLLLKHMKE